MSAVPENILGFGTWDTQGTDLPASPAEPSGPANVVDVPRSDGVTWGGILSGVQATAGTLFDTWGKVYSLQSKVEDAKFTRTVQAAQLDLQRASVLGGLDAQRAAVDAQNAIEKARAQRATADAMARVSSGEKPTKNPWVMLGALVLGGVAIWKFSK